MSEMIAKNKKFIPWLQKQHKTGAELASFCTGAFLFAASGLLNEKLATTHVDACSAFTKAFPMVKLKPEETLTADGSLYTSGGSTSTFHLLILLVQKFCGNEMAVKIAKIFSIDLNRYKQSYFSTFRPNHLHNDTLVAMLQQKIESQYQNLLTHFSSKSTRFFYACKSLTNIHILNLVKNTGCNIDCSSINEVKLAIHVGFDVENILYNSEL